MDKEFERLINSVKVNAIDDSESSDKLIDALISYFVESGKSEEMFGYVLDALKASAGCENRYAMYQYSQLVCLTRKSTREQKLQAIQYGKQSGFYFGVFYAAKLLEDPEFRPGPNGYFYNGNAGLLGRHMLNEPDFALRQAADLYQSIADEAMVAAEEEHGRFQRHILDSAIFAARLYLNKRSFGPGIPIEDWYEEKAVQDLEFVIRELEEPEEEWENVCVSYAYSILGAYHLEKTEDAEAADCFVKALEANPDSVSYFCRERINDKGAYDRILATCEKVKSRMSPAGLKGLDTFPYVWNNWH